MIGDFVFYLFAAVIVVSGFCVAFCRNIVHAAFSLLFTLLSVAALFAMLAADFLTVAQILVYVGGVFSHIEGGTRAKTRLKNIAKRLITQQIATEPAPQTISTIVRGRGEVLRFTRGIQVDGGGELGLNLDIESTTGVKTTWSILVLLGIGLTGALALRRAS